MFKDFLSLLFPECCLLCDEALSIKEQAICNLCLYQLPTTQHHLNNDNALMKRFAGRVPIKHAMAYLKYHKNSKVQRLIHQLKYKGHQEIGGIIGKVYGTILSQNNYHFDCVIPVPLHPSKLKKRGYNQSEAFAWQIADALNTEKGIDFMIRKKATFTQTKKGRYARWENVHDVFSLTNLDAVKNKNILLVDDVVTTGSTLEACAQVLLTANCKTVSILAMASVE